MYLYSFVNRLNNLNQAKESFRRTTTSTQTSTSTTVTLPEITPPQKKRKPQKSNANKDQDFINAIQKICADERDAIMMCSGSL